MHYVPWCYHKCKAVYTAKRNLLTNPFWPESFKFTVWTLQSWWQQLHSWILQVIVTQVQLSQTRGLGMENWRQSFTASLWQITASQPEGNISDVEIWINKGQYVFDMINLSINIPPTELCWRLWPLAAASREPLLKQSISSGQTHLDLFLMTVRWRPELTTEQETVRMLGDFLISGTVGSPPLENHHSVHSGSGTDWCFSLRDSPWLWLWCNWLSSSWSVSSFLSVSADLLGDSDWSAVKDSRGSGGTSPGVHLDSVRLCSQHSDKSVLIVIWFLRK